MRDYSFELQEQLNELASLRKIADKRLKALKNTEKGSLRVTTSHGYPQYYFKEEGSKTERYISTAEKDKIKSLVQCEYDKKVHDEIVSLEKRLRRFLSSYDISKLDKTYDKLCKGRKSFVVPIKPTQSMKVKDWYEQNKGMQNTFEIKNPFLTIKGETVRSKSEKIIADYFYNMDIPYVYEPKYTLVNGRTLYPDFALYNYRDNSTVYWEHMGLVDDTDYLSKNIKKIMLYEKNGLVLGQNLMISYESSDSPLDMNIIKEKLESLFGYPL